jgi:DNA-directed RNA polymerase subunit RPC12/RpoP
MITCNKCGSNNFKVIYKSPLLPSGDKYKCMDCKHIFKRYDKPINKD